MKQWPLVPMPDFVSGPNYLNFSLERWSRYATPMNLDALTPDEAVNLRDSLNAYLEYIKVASSHNVKERP